MSVRMSPAELSHFETLQDRVRARDAAKWVRIGEHWHYLDPDGVTTACGCRTDGNSGLSVNVQHPRCYVCYIMSDE